MKAQPTTRQLIEMLYERIPELFDRPQPDRNTWTPVQIGVDVTSEGVHVVGMYTPPNMPNYVFYSQVHPLAKPEQVPVAKNEAGRITWLVDGWPQNCLLYTTPPPQRKWVELTDWEINSVINDNHPLDGIRTFARAIEAKLKEKNCG